MTIPLVATSDLVVLAWLKGIDALDPTKINTTVPTDQTTWGEGGYVQVTTVGGPADRYLPAGRPVVQIDTWAVKPDTGRPLWGVANLLAQHIVRATLDEDTIRRPLDLGGDYPPARVMEVYALTEPHRVPSDPGGYARFRLDMQFHWVQEPEP